MTTNTATTRPRPEEDGATFDSLPAAGARAGVNQGAAGLSRGDPVRNNRVVSDLLDGAASALHPRLSGADGLPALPAVGAVRIADALAPGLGAELVPFSRSLPHVVAATRAPDGLIWGCEFEAPRAPDPQYPPCLFRLVRLVERDVPALLGMLTGAAWTYSTPGRLRVWLVRKGCYLAPGLADSGVRFFVGLTGVAWPAEWGGHLTVAGTGTTLSPAADVLDLVRGAGFELPLVHRHVEGLVVTGTVTPC